MRQYMLAYGSFMETVHLAEAMHLLECRSVYQDGSRSWFAYSSEHMAERRWSRVVDSVDSAASAL